MTDMIKTTRLTLRPYTNDCFDSYADLMGSDRAVHMGGPFDRGAAWKYFATDASAATLTGHGCYILWYQDVRIGFAGVIFPPDFPEPEMGWGLYDGYEGQGFVTEAARAILDYLFAKSNRDSFVSYIAPANDRSIAVAERLGATLDPNAAVPRDWHSVVYRHTRPQGAAA